MAKNKTLKGILTSLETETFLLKGNKSAFKTVVKQIKAEEALTEIAAQETEIEILEPEINKEVSQILSKSLGFQCLYSPDNTDVEVRREALQIQEEMIAVRRRVKDLTETLQDLIYQHPYLERPLNIDRYDSAKNGLRCYAYERNILEKLEERLQLLPEEAKDNIRENIQSEISQYEENIQKLQSLSKKIEELEDENITEAFRLLYVDGNKLEDENRSLEDKLKKAEQEAAVHLLSEFRKTFYEDYYNIIRLYSDESEEITIAEKARRQVDGSIFVGYYGEEEYSPTHTLNSVCKGKKILASIYE